MSELLDEKYLGSFERIYPSRHENRQQKYNRLLAYSLSSISFDSSSHKKKVSVTPAVRKGMNSETKYLTPLHEFSCPPPLAKQRMKMSRILRPEPIRESESKGMYNVFDRRKFREEIHSRSHLPRWKTMESASDE